MSGGIAYVYDKRPHLRAALQHSSSSTSRSCRTDDALEVQTLIKEHAQRTGSLVARNVLASWDRAAERFVKVMPRDYRRALEAAAASSSEAGEPVEA